jgi:predicted transcriptional regulator
VSQATVGRAIRALEQAGLTRTVDRWAVVKVQECEANRRVHL